MFFNAWVRLEIHISELSVEYVALGWGEIFVPVAHFIRCKEVPASPCYKTMIFAPVLISSYIFAKNHNGLESTNNNKNYTTVQIPTDVSGTV